MNRAKIERIGHDAKTRPVISQGRVSVVQDFVKAIPLRAGAPLRVADPPVQAVALSSKPPDTEEIPETHQSDRS